MLTKRFLLAAVAFLSMIPFAGCGCRKSCCSSSSSLAPPPGACCDKGVPPGYLPPPVGP
jgi:hypothetical protein